VKVQAIFKANGMDIEKTIKRVEDEGGVCWEVLYTQGHTHHVCKIPTLEDVTIQIFERTVNVYYEEERYSRQYIQERLRKLIVDKKGKPAKIAIKGENRKVKQKVKGVIGLVSGPLEMISPTGIVVSVRLMSGMLTASILPVGSSVWELLSPRNCELGIISSTVDSSVGLGTISGTLCTS
jgi:hypothetical protein